MKYNKFAVTVLVVWALLGMSTTSFAAMKKAEKKASRGQNTSF